MYIYIYCSNEIASFQNRRIFRKKEKKNSTEENKTGVKGGNKDGG